MLDADSVLASFLRSTDESARERLLNDLISTHAAPIIRSMVWRRLGLNGHQAGAGPGHPDSEDVYREVVKNLLQRLTDLHSGNGNGGIGNFRQYVSRVAENTCHNYLRLKTPARYHLKEALRKLLGQRREFKIWKDDQNAILCGFTEWSGREAPPDRLEQVKEITSKLDAAILQNKTGLNKNGRRPPLANLLAEIFKRAGQPIELDDLIEIVAGLLGVIDHPQESLDENSILAERLTNKTTSVEARLEMRDELRRFWNEARRLPKNQLYAICLGYSNRQEEDLLSLLLEAEAVKFAEFAEGLGLTEDQLIELWARMPMKDAVIAERLNATPDQVSKWRFLGRKELRDRMFRSGKEK
jgi:DNA-directed RNA polymerase specialized sigma24 family protein